MNELEVITRAGEVPVNGVRQQLAKQLPSPRELEERRGTTGEAEKGPVGLFAGSGVRRCSCYEGSGGCLGPPCVPRVPDEKGPFGPSPLVALSQALEDDRIIYRHQVRFLRNCCGKDPR